jgi:hypothetical protein
MGSWGSPYLSLTTPFNNTKGRRETTLAIISRGDGGDAYSYLVYVEGIQEKASATTFVSPENDTQPESLRVVFILCIEIILPRFT